MDKIIIRDLRVNALIGTLPHERLRRQELALLFSPLEHPTAQAAAAAPAAHDASFINVRRVVMG